MLKVELVGDLALEARFEAMPSKMQAAIYRKMNYLTLAFKRKLQQDHLSGPTGEHTLSVGKNTEGHSGGQLRRSVTTNVEQSSGSVTGTIGYGKDVPYAMIHEKGGDIHIPEIVPTKAKALHFIDSAGKDVFVKRVKAHTVHMPARAPLRTTFTEMRPVIEQGLKDAVKEGLQK